MFQKKGQHNKQWKHQTNSHKQTTLLLKLHPKMLRRNPTTIHLVAEDFKDIGRGIDFAAAMNHEHTSFDTNYEYNGEADNQNWDGSIDKSYLASRSRGRDVVSEGELEGGKSHNNAAHITNPNATNIDNIGINGIPSNSNSKNTAEVTTNNELLESLEDADLDQGNTSYIPKSKGRET